MTPKDRFVDTPGAINATSRLIGVGELLLGAGVTATAYDTLASNLNRYAEVHVPILNLPIVSSFPEEIHHIFGSFGDGISSAGMLLLGCVSLGLAISGAIHIIQKPMRE